jgi:hypothetical protein
MSLSNGLTRRAVRAAQSVQVTEPRRVFAAVGASHILPRQQAVGLELRRILDQEWAAPHCAALCSRKLMSPIDHPIMMQLPRGRIKAHGSAAGWALVGVH